MELEREDGKWEAMVLETIPASIDNVWEVLSDFDGAKRNFPEFCTSCRTVEGEKNKAGSLRVVQWYSDAGEAIEVSDRLLCNDKATHVTWYETERINNGWTGHKSFISLDSVDSGHTLVRWTWELDPNPMVTKDAFIKRQARFIREILQQLVSNLTRKYVTELLEMWFYTNCCLEISESRPQKSAVDFNEI